MKYRVNKVQMFMKLFVMLFSKLHHKIEENLLILFYKEEKPKYKFKGIREERGLYKTRDGKYINADVNAAANIIKKRKHEFNYERLYKWVQTAPIKIKLQT